MEPAEAWFRGRRAALGTKHRKEEVIAPLMRAELGVDVVVPVALDTDRLGTFTREVPRAGTQLEAARQKALAAMDLLGLDLGLASEGSFGPHPANPFAQGDLEAVVLIDRANGIEISGIHITADVCCEHGWVASIEDATALARRAGFPEHRLVVRRGPDDPDRIVKGVGSDEALRSAVERTLAASDDGRAFIESDLRAHCNPTRMRAIQTATLELIARARQTCPACGTPGYRLVLDRPGLPCNWCGMPTERTLARVFGCQRCDHRTEEVYPDGRTSAEPGECPYCNP